MIINPRFYIGMVQFIHFLRLLLLISILVFISAEEMQKERVKLFNICHSKMEEIVPENSRVRYYVNSIQHFVFSLL